MVFAEIESLKRSWTDKYVIVDESRPELKRFLGQTGTVKTVNMSGRCLVQFDGHNNIGWYDIDPTFLKIIDQPLPKPEAKGKGEKPKKDVPAGKAAPTTPAPEVAGKKAAAAPAGGKSVADILAAARGGAKPAAAPKAEAKSETPAAKGGAKPMSVADIIAAAKGKAPAASAAPAAEKPAAAKAAPAEAKPAAKIDPKKMSVADIIAAAKGKAPAAAAPAAPAAKPSVSEILEAARTRPSEAPPAEEEASEPAPVAAAPAADAGGKKSKQHAFKTVAEIVAYCRQVDTK